MLHMYQSTRPTYKNCKFGLHQESSHNITLPYFIYEPVGRDMLLEVLCNLIGQSWHSTVETVSTFLPGPPWSDHPIIKICLWHGFCSDSLYRYRNRVNRSIRESSRFNSYNRELWLIYLYSWVYKKLYRSQYQVAYPELRSYT